jgi:hypothetical protein
MIAHGLNATRDLSGTFSNLIVLKTTIFYVSAFIASINTMREILMHLANAIFVLHQRPS